jgi:hypothetical protein
VGFVADNMIVLPHLITERLERVLACSSSLVHVGPCSQRLCDLFSLEQRIFIAALTEDCTPVEGITAIPNTNCRPGFGWNISAGHLIFKDQAYNEVLKNNHCLVCEPKKASE